MQAGDEMRLADLSWRLKVPLLITAVILVTEVVVTALLVTRALSDARRDLEASAESLAQLLARSLRDPLLRDDLWQAFEVVKAPLATRPKDSPLQSIVVLDVADRVLVASDPRRHPILQPLDELPEWLAVTARSVTTDARFRFSLGRGPDGLELAAAGPVLAEDGARLGTVLLDFDGVVYAERVRAAVLDVALFSIPGLLLLVPLGWYAGKRLTEPLVRMADALARVGSDSPEVVRVMLPPESRDEVGQLANRAGAMLEGLARKAALEREILASERLAAVGRVAATIAHEINNPLGGMLNAIDTARRHGTPDGVTARTLGLLERGLEQIRATVAALLVEARLDSPQLRREDWDDLLLLVRPQAEARGVALQARIDEAARAGLPLPGHDVRQLVLNLLLNACAAASAEHSTSAAVELGVTQAPGRLSITVGNTGPRIPPERLSRMFEPFVSSSGGSEGQRHGLGLWVCWQIVQRLSGSIDVTSDGTWTRVSVTLPMNDSDDAERRA
jgi:signal transduction histidine kinase